jgi:hypothetical protein
MSADRSLCREIRLRARLSGVVALPTSAPMSRLLITSGRFLIALAACGGSSSGSASGTGSGSSSSSGAPKGIVSASVLHVVITGGPAAGTYDAKSAQVTCSRSAKDKTYWGNQYSDPSNKDFSSLQLIAQDAAAFSGGGTKFLTTITVKGQDLNISDLNGSKKGSGTATIQDSGLTAKVSIKGQAAEGGGIDATIQCNQVVSF